MTKKADNDLHQKLVMKQIFAEYREALAIIETKPDLQATWANNGAFFLKPLLTMGFLLNPSPYGKKELSKEDQAAHDEMCKQSRVQMNTGIPLGVIVCNLQQTRVLAILFRHFAENIPLKEKEKELKKARELGVYQSTLVSMKHCEDEMEAFREALGEPLLAIATALDELLAESKPATFWFDKRLLPEAERKVHEASLEGSSLARFLFSTSDQDWAQKLEEEGHPERKVQRALDSRRQSYQKFISRQKTNKEEESKKPKKPKSAK